MPWAVATKEAPNDDSSGICLPEFKCARDDSACLKDAPTAHRRRMAGRRCSKAEIAATKVRRAKRKNPDADDEFDCFGFDGYGPGGTNQVIRRSCGFPKGFKGF